ncbi:hypothetical protein K4K59_009317 [Colletotrichum sp. SAR11_240]|nr:hypothetical protein K4K59_009317 [Colletotrichum sp. SAR11_240]
MAPAPVASVPLPGRIARGWLHSRDGIGQALEEEQRTTDLGIEDDGDIFERSYTLSLARTTETGNEAVSPGHPGDDKIIDIIRLRSDATCVNLGWKKLPTGQHIGIASPCLGHEEKSWKRLEL